MNTGDHLRHVKKATTLRFTELWKQNFLSNQEAILRNPGVAVLKNKFRNMPVFVIGAGPSLDKNIRLLRQAAGKAVLVSSDAALKPLLQNGVTPHLVISLDPQEDILKFFTGVPSHGLTLVAPSIIHPRVLEMWEGTVVFYHKYAPDIPVLTEIRNRIPGTGVLTPGGTVLSVAYDLAFQSGGNPIIFLGQDLSYPQKNTYSRSSEKAGESLDSTLGLQGKNIVFEKDMYGVNRPTLKAMLVTKQWFQWAFTTWDRGFPVDILNCSEGGILTEHCALIPLSEAIYKFCTRGVNVSWLLKKALKLKRK